MIPRGIFIYPQYKEAALQETSSNLRGFNRKYYISKKEDFILSSQYLELNLTREERAKPFAFYFDLPEPSPLIADDLAQKIMSPMDPTKALRMENINDILDPGYDADDVGYCVLPDGTGYIGQTYLFEGSTREMFMWWWCWKGLEDLRFKIWYPSIHLHTKMSKEHIAKRLDPNQSFEEKLYNTANLSTELLVKGDKPDTAMMYFVAPNDFGFDMNRCNKENVSIVAGFSGKIDSPFPTGSSVRLCWDTPKGLFIRLYQWLGKIVLNNQFIKMPYEPSLPRLKDLSIHCAEEYGRLSSFLPQIFSEYSKKNENLCDFQESFLY